MGAGWLNNGWKPLNRQNMDNSTLATYGVKVRKDSRSSNRKGTEDIISNGSIIHVPINTYMLLVDGGKIIAATEEEGYYQVDNSRAPSIFFQATENVETAGYGNTELNAIKRPGGLINTLKDSWERFKFGGTTPLKQTVIYINKQEIPDIRFGTKTPIPYTDRMLVPGRVVPCKVTSFGTYSIKIGDPLLFYSEVVTKTANTSLSASDMAEQYINEFLMAYTTALVSLSTNNVLVSDIPVKTQELGQYMAEVLDKDWLAKRGFYIHSVGIAGISFDDKTNELLEKYANISILMDPNARAARMTEGMAAGMQGAGSNPSGAMVGFASMAMGMNAAGAMGLMPGQQPTAVWICSCGNAMALESAFCSKCGSKKPVNEDKSSGQAWKCSCGRNVSEGEFCPGCGKERPVNEAWTCSCGNLTEDLFCSKCGNKKPGNAKE